MRINPETVERIKQTADIVEVVGDFVSLKKKGANYSACCPFHNEKTPSFNVNPVRQIYKCFGCGAAGDSIKFVMDIDGVGYGEALRYLADKYNIEIEQEEVTDEEALRQNERESLYIILNFAKNFYVQQLHESDEGQAVGLSYFKERGFTGEIRKKFELGYSLDTWDAFSKVALDKGYSSQLLEKAGLLIHKEGSQTAGYDRFRGRVIFPIHNVAGKVIAFGARILKSDKSKAANQPKYLNSPETEVYHKSDVLYGIFQAKNAIRQLDHCYLVEGYTDVISLNQGGIENVVASSGTSLTVEQIRLIGRFTPNVTILYDGDIAGIKAALRGLDLVLEEGLNVSIVLFPDGDDPDSYVRKVGAEAFKIYLKQNSKDFITFKTEMLLQDAGNDPFRLAAVIGEVVNSIVKIPDAIKRQVFFHRTSEMMKVDEQMLITEGNKLLRKLHTQKPQERAPRQNQAPESPADLDALFSGDPFSGSNEPSTDFYAPETGHTEAPQRSKLYYQEEAFIRLLVVYGTRELEPTITVCQYVLSEIEGIDFRDTIFHHLLVLFRENFNRNHVLPTDYFLHHHEPEIRNLTIDWLANKYELSELWSEKYEIFVPFETDVLDKTAFINILRLKKAFIEEKMKVCLQQAVHAKTEEEQTAIMSEFMYYKGISMAAAKELGSVIG
ncbi:DNA primase [Dyadobacter fanqingshengii]|uniref:DNA primase n=1 Tax=Dyadobacter fanqingshengii TaxID=2906443 RepID=A0A9X1PDI7_9BACT|nr:DNA primase [Dyadobacter fanqingshengii]MCF0042164.1 DNA primase [Dyadobacter fanqingshengii]USJ35304.1 DNA primase [Dyadobacter fanqingshengii]